MYHTYMTRTALLELILRDAFSHCTGRAYTPSDHLEHVVHIVGSTPFLMRNHIDLAFHLGLLDQLSVRTHALLGESFGELVADEGGGVEAGKCDELPTVAQLAEAHDVGLLFLAWHGSFPIERWGEVIGESGIR